MSTKWMVAGLLVLGGVGIADSGGDYQFCTTQDEVKGTVASDRSCQPLTGLASP
jgi:hypothetical protein